jgi:hypothetical protein
LSAFGRNNWWSRLTSRGRQWVGECAFVARDACRDGPLAMAVCVCAYTLHEAASALARKGAVSSTPTRIHTRSYRSYWYSFFTRTHAMPPRFTDWRCVQVGQLAAVLTNSTFQADPFAAIQAHLRATMPQPAAEPVGGGAAAAAAPVAAAAAAAAPAVAAPAAAAAGGKGGGGGAKRRKR